MKYGNKEDLDSCSVGEYNQDVRQMSVARESVAVAAFGSKDDFDEYNTGVRDVSSVVGSVAILKYGNKGRF